MELKPNIEQKSSMLLSKEENDQVFQLLGPRCQVILLLDIS